MSRVWRGFVCGALCAGLSGPAWAVELHVDASAACPGTGSAAAPYCTIGQAAAVAAPGDVVNVAAGVYREQVTPPASGAAGLPITYRGAPGARILGTNSLSGPGVWTLASGTTYAAAYDPPTNPAQVFVDGVRLAASSAGAGAVPAGGFFYDAAAKTLYVNLGGADPGSRAVEAGARSFGFAIQDRAHLVVEGFELVGYNTNGIRVRSSSHVAVRGNHVLRAAGFGIVADGTLTPVVTTTGPVEISGNDVAENGDAGIRLRNGVVNATVSGNRSHHNANHGILATATTDSTFSANELFANARPGGVSTTGLLLDGDADRNRVIANLAWGNQDSGFQVSGGADGNVLARNISHGNGDHGFDVRESDVTKLVSNTAWANTNDGFSVEGGALRAYLRNNVGVDNGLFTNGNDLWVDASSTTGFSADYDVFHRSIASGNTIDYAGAEYTNAADFAAATGHETHGSSANPNLVDPAAGNFHPALGPAIDAADASAEGFEMLDFAGMPPVDLTGVADTGAGVPTYADRGALERLDTAPVARLATAPKGKLAVGTLLTADGSASTDDAGIVSYRFAWGDGSADTVQAGPVATHTYTRTGNFKLRLTVTDGSGQSSTVQKGVNVKASRTRKTAAAKRGR